MSEKDNDPIGKALGVASVLPAVTKEANQLVKESMDSSAIADFERARENITDLIETGQNALQDLLSIATSSQHPRAFEVATNLIKTLVESNKDLLALQEKIRDIGAHPGSPASTQSGPKVQNNLIINGTTAEIQKILAGLKNNPVIENND